MTELRMTTEAEAAHLLRRSFATERQLLFARMLQRSAFPDEHDPGPPMEGDFEPAPLYLRQATTLLGRRETLLDVFTVIEAEWYKRK